MSWLIANKVNTNMCLVYIKLFSLSALSYVHIYTTYTTIITTITNCYKLFASHTWTLIFSHDYLLTIFFKNATSHKTNWITTNCCLLCLAFLSTHNLSLQNVLKVEGSHFCLLENSIVTAWACAFSYLCVPLLIYLELIYLECIRYICVLRTH